MKYKLFASLIVLILGVFQTESQIVKEWEATYNGPGNHEDYPNDIAVDSYGNVIVTGRSRGINTGFADIVTIKYDAFGNQMWIKRYNHPANQTDQAYRMEVDESNNIYVAGFSPFGPVIIKYDNNGNEIFSRVFLGGGWFTSSKKDNLGNIYFCGHFNDSILIVKYYSSGQEAWTIHSRPPGLSQSIGFGLNVDNNGNVYACGSALDDAFIAKFNVNGIYQWSNTYNSIFNRFERFVDLTVLYDGSVVTGGFLFDTNSFGRGLLIKYNSQGVLQWTIIDQAMSIDFVKTDGMGNIYLGALYYPGTGQHGAGIIKYNKSGVRQWVRYHLPQPGFNESIRDMEVKNCSSLYINYLSSRPDSATYFGISKFNSNGALKWEYSEQGQIFITDTTFGTGSTCMALDNNRNIYTARTGVSAPKYNDIHTIKYRETFYTVSGRVTYRDNNQPVEGGYVKALYYDQSSAGLITVDSTEIQPGGYYTLAKVPSDTLDIMFYQDDDLLRFVPTYYVSTIDWREATKIYPTQNLTNIDGQVFRINNQNNPFNYSGTCSYNVGSGLTEGLKDAIVYTKSGNDFKNYGIAEPNGSYSVTKLPAGTYSVVAMRKGFLPVLMNVTITNSNLSGVNLNFGNPISVEKKTGKVPTEFVLSQNYPNPFNPVTTIDFDIPSSAFVKLSVFDLLGREVEVLVNEQKTSGSYSVQWNASNYSSGVYFYRIETTAGSEKNFVQTRKMILIK